MALKMSPTLFLIGLKKIGFDISEIVFVNWNAGGTSSISGLLKENLIAYTAKTITTGQMDCALWLE
jgi:hypothetical protein